MSEEMRALIRSIIELAIVPVIGALAAYAIAFIKSKTAAFIDNQKFQNYRNYITIAENTVCDVITAIESSIVKAAKYKEEWTDEKKREAFNEAKALILKQLAANGREAIRYLYGDLDAWLESQINKHVLQVSSSYRTTEYVSTKKILAS